MTLLCVESLRVQFRTEDGNVSAVNDVSFSLDRGQVLGIVGESGSGKSVTCRAILGLERGQGIDISGKALFKGNDLLKMKEGDLRDIRGRDVAMIFQDPMSAMNPVRSVGSQLVEAIRIHGSSGRRVDWKRARDLLGDVGIPNPGGRMSSYPGEMSGGMRQRVMIAMALLNKPDLLIADEPTTALDVTTQAQVLDLLRDLRRDIDAAIILITHDLGVVAELCDEVLVMYGGRGVETGPVADIFSEPSHPYTWGLLASLPTMNRDQSRIRSIPGSPPSPLATISGCAFHSRCESALPICQSVVPEFSLVRPGQPHAAACHLPTEERHAEAASRVASFATAGAGGSLTRDGLGLMGSPDDPSEFLVRVSGLTKEFPIGRGALAKTTGFLRAVSDVTFDIRKGQTVAVVGESGCGKSTLARCVARLIEPTAGHIEFQGRDISSLSRAQMESVRRDVMVVFQDPYGSLDPRMRVGEIIAEPLHNYAFGDRRQIRERVQQILEIVGLNPEHFNRFPHEFSGGQRQRVGIARALALNPKLVVCDEPVSALDVSVQAQILNLLADLRDELGLTYLFISHNLDVVRHVADRVLVMYLGQIVEEGTVEQIFASPSHPYTAALLSAVPIPDPSLAKQRRLIALKGEIPNPANPPTGCTFHTRCPVSQPVCAAIQPALIDVGSGQLSRCHFPQDVLISVRPVGESA